MQTYGYRTFFRSSPPANTPIKAFGANSSRVCLIISVSAGTGASKNFQVLVSNTTAGTYLLGTAPVQLPIPYRDYGPVIQDEVWIAVDDISQVISITETFPIGTAQKRKS